MTAPRDATSRNRTYYAGDLRRDLLDAATTTAATLGPSNVSLRDLARQLGVSHAAPKNHFADKQALFTAVATESHERLAAAMHAAVAAVDDDPVRRLVAAGRSYLVFAREHPGHFAVMWQEDMQDRSDPDLLRAAADTFGLLAALAADVGSSDVPILAGRPAVQIAVFAWAFAHGIADLAASGALDDLPGADDPSGRDDALLDLIEALLRRKAP